MAENAFAALTSRLEAGPMRGPGVPPTVDPRAAALAAMMVAELVGRAPAAARFERLASTGELDARVVEDLGVAARGLLHLLGKVGRAETTLDERLVARARDAQQSLVAAVDANVDELGGAGAVLDYVRLGAGPVELSQNLRVLASFCATYAENLVAGRTPTPGDLAAASALADELEASLASRDDAARREARVWLHRAWALFEHAYEEVGRAGRFLFHHEKPLLKFPPLLAVGAASRRLRRAEEAGGEAAAHATTETREDEVLDVHVDELVFEGDRGKEGAPAHADAARPAAKSAPSHAAAPADRKPLAPPRPSAARPPVPLARPPRPAPSTKTLAAAPRPAPKEELDAGASPAPHPVPKAETAGPASPPRSAPKEEVDAAFDTLFAGDDGLTEAPISAPRSGEASGAPASGGARTTSSAGIPAAPSGSMRTASSAGIPAASVGAMRTASSAGIPAASSGSMRTASSAGMPAVTDGNDDKRATRRFPVQLRLTLGAEDEVSVGALENLSDKGAFVATPTPRPAGTRLVLLLSHPETEEVLQLGAVVRWGRPARRGVGLEAGVGVEFVELTDAQREALARLVAS